MLLRVVLLGGMLIAQAGRTTPTNPFCGYDCDQCTSFVEEYVHDEYGFWMDIDGDARGWIASAIDRNWPVGNQPAPGAILVIPGDDLVWVFDDDQDLELWQVSDRGHVAVIDAVQDGWVHVLDRNWDGTGLNGSRWFFWNPAWWVIYVGPNP